MSLTRSTKSPITSKANAEKSSLPLPPGEGFCNSSQAYLSKIIHKLSTTSLAAVDNCLFSVSKIAHLSTKNCGNVAWLVDNFSRTCRNSNVLYGFNDTICG